MKRRAFIKSTVAATSLAGVSPFFGAARAAESGNGSGQYYELRRYTLDSEDQRRRVDAFWKTAAIPALNRLGIRPVGAFVELDPPESRSLYVLIPYRSLERFASVASRLEKDEVYQRTGADYLRTPKSDPAYVRFESALLIAFEGMKQLEVPAPPAADAPRIFELRTYESHSETMGFNKVKMFNSGEIPLMKEVGLGPVFFGRCLVGDRLPHLTYMVSGEDRDAHKKHWAAFFQAPVWKGLIGDPQYKNNVSKVTNVFLKRTDYSQI